MFRTKACATSHSFDWGPSGKDSLSGSRSDFNTITGFTAAMWNHASNSRIQASGMGVQSESFSGREMTDLIAFLNDGR